MAPPPEATPHQLTRPLRLVQIGAEWLSPARMGGANRYAEGLARALSARGIDQHWLVMGDEGEAPALSLGVRRVSSPDAPLWRRYRALQQGWDAICPAPDCATSHFALYAYPLLRRLHRMPHVVHFHGPWAAESRAEGAGRMVVALKRRLEKSVYASANRFITLSQAFADVLVKDYRVDAQRTRVIPGGVDVDRFDLALTRREARSALGWPQDRPTVLCVRRLVHRMGLERLVEAMETVRVAHPEVRLVIAGKGPLTPELQETIRAKRLGPAVELLGFVPDEQLPLAYRAADLSIVPSQSLEGFGLIIAESLAAGTPALVTPVGGMPEVVHELSPDLVLAGSGGEEIAAGLTAALDGQLRVPTSQECAAYARRRFDWPQVAERVLAVYEEAIASHG
ncbi:Mannosylfructose-phosphate synthase [Botrimarina colliarenosi]|uniref:Mannosylfructose-phosphate synthase n=1 Tax=Botrimarina colliarenosi TaxID=2528001 RepID=A0A5C6AD24_9BACT|nr:glycosyltransferase family 4 protein [Botrimarina colliarenosi]TWT97962.1 Mannosylfructose-phosphate synthase [Botrimarina colliarenosi]